MRSSQKQGELFKRSNLFGESASSSQELIFSKKFLETWQEKIHSHQSKLFQGIAFTNHQTSLFEENTQSDLMVEKFQPLKLTPLPLSFWRSSKPHHNGQAIYIVVDKLNESEKFIILYIGETISADQRWKGEHDCKTYLDNYCVALQKVGLSSQLSIRFWNDVPKQTIARRKLEQELIQKWLPPFNKETRSRWQTPFTTEIY